MQWPWRKAETDLEREMRFHLESLADGFEREGLTRAEAMQRARREFGGVEQFTEQCRDERRWQPLARFGQDLSFGWRMLRKTPAVTAAAVLSLALGIGATTAILSLINTLLWRQLAVPHPEQLTEILWQSKQRADRQILRSSSGSGYQDGALRVADFFSQATFQQMREQAADKAEVAAHTNDDDVSTSFAGVTSVVKLRPVSGNFFSMLGVQPASGRLLGPDDGALGAPLAIVVSDHFWQTVLGGGERVAGQALRVNNHVYTIAGVLPRAFGGIVTGEATDLYTTIAQSPAMLDPGSWEHKSSSDPTAWGTQLVARLAPGVSSESLRPVLDAAFRASWPVQPADPESTPTVRLASAATGLGKIQRNFSGPLSLLFALVALVLLIACANIANLLLARADSRRKEAALRVSLGCSRARLIRQFFTESALLALIGGALSVVVTYATANFAVTLLPIQLRLDFNVDASMLLLTAAVSFAAVMVFGIYPAWRASRVDAAPALKEGAGSVGGARGHGWLAPGKLLVFAQVALGVLLVAAAATFNAHLRKLVNTDAGFERTRLLMFDLRPGQTGYRDDRLRQFYLDLEQRLAAVPGVEAAGLARIRPMKGGGYFDTLRFAGDQKLDAAINFLTADYLRALGVKIVAGRGLSAQDVRSGAPVGVISEDLAGKLGPSAVGSTFLFDDNAPFQVVGVASRARYGRLTDNSGVLYVPSSLKYDTLTALLRTSIPPRDAVAGVRAAVGELDRDLPLVQVMTMESQIAETLRRERLFAWLCGAFGVLALLLCMVGLYGVMSYAAARRRQEIGIRMALGASPRDVLRHIVGEGMGVAAFGLLIGAPLAYFAAQKYVNYKQLGMEPLEPAIIAWATVALALSALLAVLAPALRAAASDPVKALREG